ncbi:MAG: hypothetical protein KDE20_15320, partial [Caldilineaceae bacterium]|nr:hypothetical protein [Caldilineaceae bacterium]
MFRRSWLFFTPLLVLLLALPPSATYAEVPVQSGAVHFDGQDRVGWSAWSARWNAVAADGEDFWLASDGRLLRWNPSAGIVETVTTADGLPHTVLYDVITDGAGGIWLSGDGGLSRRDGTGRWQHVATPEPPRADDGYLSAGATGELWLASATSTAVMRRDADGAWTTYADGRAAVEADFPAILASLTRGRLWTVSHGEVWVGFEAYDGATWHVRPAPDGSMDDAAQDAAGNIYLHTMPKVIKWNGSAWMPLEMDDHYFSSTWPLFAVTPSGVPWSLSVVSWTPSVSNYFLVRLTPSVSSTDLGYPPTGTHLLATDETLWLFGWGWVRAIPTAAPETATLYPLEVKAPPYYQLRADATGTVSMRGVWGVAPYVSRDTLARWDDGWVDFTEIELLDEWEYAPDGSLWYVQREMLGPPYLQRPKPPRHRIGDTVVAYPSWSVADVADVWAMTVVDANVVLFGVTADNQPAVLRLDNRGTPANFGDDRWQRTDLPSDARYGDILEDGAGRLWLAASTGMLYRHDDTNWRELAPVRANEGGEFVPAADGTMYLAYNRSKAVLVVRPDDTVEEKTPTALATDELARVLTARRTNPRWAVAGDTLWFTRTAADGVTNELVRQSPGGQVVTSLPAFIPLDRELLVDHAGRLWTTDGMTVWWYGALPD